MRCAAWCSVAGRLSPILSRLRGSVSCASQRFAGTLMHEVFVLNGHHTWVALREQHACMAAHAAAHEARDFRFPLGKLRTMCCLVAVQTGMEHMPALNILFSTDQCKQADVPAFISASEARNTFSPCDDLAVGEVCDASCKAWMQAVGGRVFHTTRQGVTRCREHAGAYTLAYRSRHSHATHLHTRFSLTENSYKYLKFFGKDYNPSSWLWPVGTMGQGPRYPLGLWGTEAQSVTGLVSSIGAPGCS